MSRVDDPGKLGETLRPGERYFQVRVNEMFLARERNWFTTCYPMVYVGSEFLYDREEVAIPFVIGPSTLGPSVDVATHDMVFRNTRVAGVSPYRGGRLTITLVLYRVAHENYARNVLNMVENLAGALDFASAIGVYTRISGALLDGVETLTGAEGTAPVLGHRIEIDPDAGDRVDPAYFVLVDMPEDRLAKYELWVRDDALVHGPTLESAKPFRDADYVLYSLASTPQRSDIERLPFFELWQRVLKEAAVPQNESWASAKANMLSLYQTMLLSPDLLRDHARALASRYSSEMKQVFDDAVDMANLSDEAGEADEQADIRNESLKILEM
jgi:hypothetical protein